MSTPEDKSFIHVEVSQELRGEVFGYGRLLGNMVLGGGIIAAVGAVGVAAFNAFHQGDETTGLMLATGTYYAAYGGVEIFRKTQMTGANSATQQSADTLDS